MAEDQQPSCQRCGRKLTDPRSIKRGYGPVCLRKLLLQAKKTEVGQPVETPNEPDEPEHPVVDTLEKLQSSPKNRERTGKIDDWIR